MIFRGNSLLLPRIMKRLLSIGLIALLLFNTMGYYVVFVGMQMQAQRDMEQRLDGENLDGEELFTIKIPINLSYWQNMPDYERVNGRFEHNGEFYTLFKQKVENDTLQVVCIKDHAEKKLFTQLSQTVKWVLGSDNSSSHQKTAKFLQNLIKDYLPLSKRVILFLFEDVEALQTPIFEASLVNFYPSLIAPPPEAMA